MIQSVVMRAVIETPWEVEFLLCQAGQGMFQGSHQMGIKMTSEEEWGIHVPMANIPFEQWRTETPFARCRGGSEIRVQHAIDQYTARRKGEAVAWGAE